MKQLIIRVEEYGCDAEILEYDADQNKEYFSKITVNDLMQRLNKFCTDRFGFSEKKDIFIADDTIIGKGKSCVVIHQPEHKRIVTYNKKAYDITFPNAIYIMTHHSSVVKDIEAYCYKKYSGKLTKLYKYAMPNMLIKNRICMGNAPKEIVDDDYVAALEKIIFTQYSHSFTDNIKSFKDTVRYFEYLSKNEFPYDLLIDANMTLNDATT